MEKVQAFLNALHNDPRVKELAKGIRKPENDRETAEAYLELAKKMGYEITRQEMAEGLKQLEQAQKASTAEAEKTALAEEELESVAGGNKGDDVPEDCDSTYQENEWCWINDSCSYLIVDYSEESCDNSAFAPNIGDGASQQDIWNRLYNNENPDGAREFIYGDDTIW